MSHTLVSFPSTNHGKYPLTLKTDKTDGLPIDNNKKSNHVSCVIKCYFSLFMSLYLAWEPNKQYVYTVQGRALTALHQLANQFAGILIKAELAIEPQTRQELRGKVWKPTICSQIIL
jgi:hypothetical protein